MCRASEKFMFDEALRLMRLAIELREFRRAAVYARNAALYCPDRKYARQLRAKAHTYAVADRLAYENDRRLARSQQAALQGVGP